MSAPAQSDFEVILNDKESGASRVIGVVRFDPNFLMTIKSAQPAEVEYLNQIVETMNGQSILHIDVPPPVGANRYALYSKPIGRTASEFFDALKEHLHLYYDVELKPA